jgi:hypothetical protein
MSAQHGIAEGEVFTECATCTELGAEHQPDECPKSKRSCGHHCNHSWESDICCWCGTEIGADQ